MMREDGHQRPGGGHTGRFDRRTDDIQDRCRIFVDNDDLNDVEKMCVRRACMTSPDEGGVGLRVATNCGFFYVDVSWRKGDIW